ncbi:MAG: hypothetical protein WBP81_23355 [Solirubrobacteraceae bacterium]
MRAAGPKRSPRRVSGLPTTHSDDTGSVNLSSSSPTFIDGEGNVDSYEIHTFNVPSGADYLNGDITWNAASPGTSVFDPQGQVAAYSLIGTDQSGFGHVEVRQPGAGTWTAVIFTIHNAAYTGSVKFSYATETFHSTGSISPASLTLAPGHSGTFHVTVTPGQAGDESLRLHLGTGGSSDGSIPIVVRALVPLGSSGGSFAGSLTGGGSTGNAGQSFTYQFRVPRGKPSLNLSLQLADPNYDLEGFLVDPSGEPVDLQSTARFDASDNFLGFGPTMQFLRGEPAAGLWTLTLLVSGPVDGTHLSEPFNGAISFAAPQISSSGIPNSRGTVLPAGQPVTATIRVRNTGNIRKDFFADARLRERVPQVLLGVDVNAVPLPLPLSAQPNWLVPPGTDALTVLAQATVPITMETSFFSGDPDVGGVSFGNAAVSRLTAPEVAPGFFFALPEATGPFPVGGVGNGATVNLAAVANANPFDPAVSANADDVWAQSVDASASYTPLSIGSGDSGTIILTIIPNARRGKVVHGFVAVDTFNLASFSGDELTKIPYTYKVG